MLHQITHLKAPWPAGAKVGDIIDLETVPVWAVGKCKVAAEDATATISLPRAAVPGEAKADDGTGKLPDALAEHVKQPQESAQTAASAIDEQAAYELAQADEKASLKAEAEALGIKVDARWGAKRLSEEIAAAKG